MSNPKNCSQIALLLVTHYYPAHRGGVEIVAGKLAEYLSQEYSVNITWAASNTDSPPLENTGIKYLSMKAFNWTENRIGIPYPFWDIQSLLQLYREVKKADIIHFHDYLYFGNLFTFFVAKILRKPIVITQHIGWIPYRNPLFSNLLSFLNNTLGSLILRNTHQVIFISQVVQDYFVQKTRFRCPPLLIPNGVDTQIFYPASSAERQQIRQELGLSVNQPLLLFVGRFVEKKGLHILHQLAAKLPEIQWTFAGWGAIDPDEWKLPNVTVFRGLSGKTLAPLYQCADLLVLPSIGEGFPLVVQEAMACGTPAMVAPETAYAYPPASDLILTTPVEGERAIEQWLESLQAILEDVSSLEQQRSQLADFAHQHWCWQTTVQRYYRVLALPYSWG